MRSDPCKCKPIWWLIVVAWWLVGAACSSADESSHQANGTEEPGKAVSASVAMLVVPEEYQQGAQRFQSFCSSCHGEQGAGTDHGPPLVHKIYEPSHHADMAFFRAAAQGVRAHHWKFGNMPKIADASEGDVQEIVNYVRWLQQQAGIF